MSTLVTAPDLTTIPLAVWMSLHEEVKIFLDKRRTGSIVLSLNYSEGNLLTYDVSGKGHHKIILKNGHTS